MHLLARFFACIRQIVLQMNVGFCGEIYTNVLLGLLILSEVRVVLTGVLTVLTAFKLPFHLISICMHGDNVYVVALYLPSPIDIRCSNPADGIPSYHCPCTSFEDGIRLVHRNVVHHFGFLPWYRGTFRSMKLNIHRMQSVTHFKLNSFLKLRDTCIDRSTASPLNSSLSVFPWCSSRSSIVPKPCASSFRAAAPVLKAERNRKRSESRIIWDSEICLRKYTLLSM